jgi:cobalt-precorrin-7 (C5)-methyltransferase
LGYRLIIAGIGPGSSDYILPAALRAIAEASVLIGGGRALKSYAQPHQETYTVGSDIAGLIEFIRRKLMTGNVVVMVSGDPGYYSLLATLRDSVPTRSLQVIPGISSFQMAFARIGIPWQTARLLSAHGREPDKESLKYEAGQLLSFLTDPKNNPARIAGWLQDQGWPLETCVWLCRDLSYETEAVLQATLQETLDSSNFDSCVMVVKG